MKNYKEFILNESKVRYKYLDEKLTIELKEYINSKKEDISSEIENLVCGDYIVDNYDYHSIFNDFILNNIYNDVNYHFKNYEYYPPALTNSTTKYLNQIYEKWNIEDSLRNRLIKIFKDNLKFFDLYLKDIEEEYRDPKIIDAMQFYLTPKQLGIL